MSNGLSTKGKIMKKYKKRVINIFGCPKAGKTTIMSGVFCLLKLHDIQCEIAPDYPKEIMWEKRFSLLSDKQYYIFAKQLKRIEELYEHTDIVLTDSPLLINLVYNKEKNNALHGLVIEENKKYNNINYFIKRTRPIVYGCFKLKTEAQIITIEKDIEKMLKGVEHKKLLQTPETINTIFLDIMKMLNKSIKFTLKKEIKK